MKCQSLIFIALLVVSLAGCGKEPSNTVEKKEATERPSTPSLPQQSLKRAAPIKREPKPLSEEDQVLLQEEDAPVSLADAENVVGEVADMANENFDPLEAKSKLRQAAALMTTKINSATPSEQSRLETVSHHLRTIAELMGKDAASDEKALSTLKSLMQMYMP